MELSTLDLENSILKTLITFPDLLKSEPLNKIADKFNSLANQETLQAMIAIVEKAGSAAPLETLLISHFKNEKRIAAIMDAPVIHMHQFPALCVQLGELGFRRQIAATLEQLKESVENQDRGLVEVVAEIEDSSINFSQQINNRAQKHLGKNGELISIREYLDTPETSTLKTGLADIDERLKFRPGTLNILAGRPAMGKSALGTFMADEFALRGQRPVLFVSLEMESRDLQCRRIAKGSRIPHEQILNRTLSPEARDMVLSWEEFINGSPLYYDVNPESTLSTIKASVRRVIQREGTISAFFVDYIQLMSRDVANKTNELDVISKGLRILAREFEIPCIALAQLNRGVEGQSNKRPTMADIRNCGAIEQHADSVTLLYRDDYYDEASPDAGITEVIVSKNRNGPTGTIKILHELHINNYKSKIKGLNQ